MNAATVFMVGLPTRPRNDEWTLIYLSVFLMRYPRALCWAGKDQRYLHALAATTPPTAARRDVRSRTSHAVRCSSSAVTGMCGNRGRVPYPGLQRAGHRSLSSRAFGNSTPPGQHPYVWTTVRIA